MIYTIFIISILVNSTIFLPSASAVSIQEDIYSPGTLWVKQVESYWHEFKISNEEYDNFLAYTVNNDIIPDAYYYQEINDVIVNEKMITKNMGEKSTSRNTITYSYEIPLYADEKIIFPAIESAFNTWEMMNPKLNYERVDSGGDITINFEKNVLDHELGSAWVFCYNDCTINLSLGAHDCISKWSHITKDSLRDTTLHEIGHTLGLLHSQDERNLMFSFGVLDDEVFYDLGYRIPQKLQTETYTVGEIKIIGDIDDAHDRIEKVLDGFGLTVDEYFMEGERSNDPSFDNKLVPLIDEYNVLIENIDCHYQNREYKINPYEFLR